MVFGITDKQRGELIVYRVGTDWNPELVLKQALGFFYFLFISTFDVISRSRMAVPIDPRVRGGESSRAGQAPEVGQVRRVCRVFNRLGGSAMKQAIRPSDISLT